MSGLVLGAGSLIMLLGSFFCFFSLFLVSFRFLYTLMALEQMKAILLLGSLFVKVPQESTYFVALLVMFTMEAVMGLVVLTRVWSSGSLMGLGWW